MELPLTLILSILTNVGVLYRRVGAAGRLELSTHAVPDRSRVEMMRYTQHCCLVYST
jgi:hypothetical protein